jgi:hypothetical protein
MMTVGMITGEETPAQCNCATHTPPKRLVDELFNEMKELHPCATARKNMRSILMERMYAAGMPFTCAAALSIAVAARVQIRLYSEGRGVQLNLF